MSIRCKQVQEALAGDHEMQEDIGSVLQTHVSECEECSEFEIALAMLDDQLSLMPKIEPPDILVAQVLSVAQVNFKPSLQVVSKVEQSPDSEKDAKAEPPGGTWWGGPVGIGGLLAAAAGIALVATSTWSEQKSNSKASANEMTGSSTVTYRAPKRGYLRDPMNEKSNGLWNDLDDRTGDFHYYAGADGDEGRNSTEVASVTSNGKMQQLGQGLDSTLTLDTKGRPNIDTSSTTQGVVLDKAFLQNLPNPLEEEGEPDDWDGKDPGGTGERLGEEEGQMGKKESTRAAGQFAIKNNSDGDALAFKEARQQARNAGVLGILSKRESQQGLGRSALAGEPFDHFRSAGKGKDEVALAFSGSTSTENSYTVDGVSTDLDVGIVTRNENTPVDQPKDMREKKSSDSEFKSVLGNSDASNFSSKIVEKIGQQEAEKSEETRRISRLDEAKILRDVAQAFLAEKEDVSVATIASNGFWSNNYIPDSPGLRLLASRLAGDPNAARLGTLDSDFSPYEPHLDAPKNSALGVSVRSDRRVVDGPTRMLIQVGIQGTAKKPGRRSALNIGVVLDLSGHTSSKQAQETMGKLLKSLRAAKQSGDRFSLTIANAPGGLLLTPKQFRSGPLTVAMRSLFSGGISEQPTLSLREAALQATAQVTLDDDPSAPLGRSSVLLVTASGSSAADQQELLQLAHANTAKGIGFSAIGIGEKVDDGQLTSLVSAGHGHRRLVLQVSRASAAITDTLADAESVVARAVRMRVHLAPGVKLVEVVSAKRLDAAAARQTRAAEQSIDKRIDRAQGIESDREQDEDGIKIIIPSFSAGESHVILLDVIVPGPGSVADISVSYKDLVHLRNGKSKTSLAIARGSATERDKLGTLERGVFRNYVGLVVAQRLKTAGRLLGTKRDAQASATLTKLHDLLVGLSLEYSWLQRDTVFVRDLRAVQRFRELLDNGATASSKNYIAHSLKYAGWRKIVQAPAVNPTTR